MLFDVHAHLDDKKFDKDLDKVIENAVTSNVEIIINNGVNLQSNIETLKLSKRYRIIKPALGLSPVDAVNLTDKELSTTINFIKQNSKRIVAIGEIGLDYKWVTDQKLRDRQKEVFLELILLAKKLNKPVIVHSRNAEKEVIRLLVENEIQDVVIHSYTGPISIIEDAINMGYYFSIPPIALVSKNIKRLIKKVPLNRLLTETDSPYQGSKRGVRNEPKNITEVIDAIALVKYLNKKELINILFKNYTTLFE